MEKPQLTEILKRERLRPVEVFSPQGNRLAVLCSTLRTEDPVRLAVLEGVRLLGLFPDKAKKSMKVQGSLVLLGGKFVLFSKDDAKKVEALDIETLKVSDFHKFKNPNRLRGLDVDPTGNLALFNSQFDDFPAIEVFDVAKEELIEFNCDALIDTRLEDMQWDGGIERIHCDCHLGIRITTPLDWNERKALWKPSAATSSYGPNDELSRELEFEIGSSDFTSKDESEVLSKVCNLLDQGANPNRRSYHGLSLLHVAIQARMPSIVEKLIERGANVDIVSSKWGLTPLQLAIQKTVYSDDERCLRSLRIVMEANPNIDIRTKDNQSAVQLALACRSNHGEAVLRMLIAKGAVLSDADRKTANAFGIAMRE